MAGIEILDIVLSTVDNNTRKPEQFLSVQNKLAEHFKDSTKRLYDFAKEESKRKTNALPELVTEGFDEEQIWQQLELQNEGELMHFVTGISKILAGGKKLNIPIKTENDETIDTDEESLVDEETDEEILEDDVKSLNPKEIKKSRKRSSIVDDKFFKLQELDEYLTKEEKKEKQISNEETSDDESVDLFNDHSDDEDSIEESKLLKYTDFFDNPCSDDEETATQENIDMNIDEIEEQNDKCQSKKVTFNLTNDSDETDSLENKSNDRKEEEELKSSLEKRHDRLQKKIEELEGEALSEKPWQLKGEVSATSRPQNSLLQEFVEFDVTSRPPPVITEETTIKLEDIIKRRIKDKAWDDVEKKFKPVETPLEYKKKLVLNQEKSKESLSQIYEKEYLKQKEKIHGDNNEPEEEEPKLFGEVREMMHSLFCKLDALSNFHYTPKLAKPDIKIISNIPAINMEEVAPIATSDAVLLAPEEIKEKLRGDIIGKTERTKTDMKRDRRRKKMKQRGRNEALEKKDKLNALKPSIAKKYKKNNDLIKKLSKDRNIVRADETKNINKSSTSFFNELQDQVKSQIKMKNSEAKKKKKNVVTAVKLKL